MTQTAINHISYNNSEKAKIRDYILNHAGQGKAYLELYGNGESYSIAKKKGINVLSIDDGRQEHNQRRLKKELKGKGRMFISLQDLCKSKMKRLNDVMWLDYCGILNKDIFKDLMVIPNIMAKKGLVFVTFRCGREYFFPRGSSRELIKFGVRFLMKKHMRAEGIKLKDTFYKEYQSPPKGKSKKGTTRMCVWGFSWIKNKTK